ncbi:3',5'-cyclic-nucleotide phosphodiesterase [Mitosporidium daphniae]|uniref:3',5'-cyclic-nucleotide phosphodiesterase n=1 Tax=Mitosporidium daphniae TaxID=1485682 RepID=A0A098VQM2_9MICR|nr:3',5'-cyclic-nucleotide phosphodiesterase [Mitosporidium daphniae]KGG50026.1 3',5'-cyclic-nucleotide phosphodiesterase [Mitosporidium daphniae]|eukprot:XP_013236462.1 3',5'-cyclic-nucleotide phosphodiesterase [Mitosporidium daphniae]
MLKFFLCFLPLTAMTFDILDAPINSWLVPFSVSKSRLAREYNDVSVLELYHWAQLRQILKNTEGFNALPSLSGQMKDDIIKMLYEYIIATDLARHFTFIQKLTVFLSQKSYSQIFETKPGRILISCCIIKFSDISNVSRPFHIYMKWVNSLVNECIIQNKMEDIFQFPCHQFDVSNISAFQRHFMDKIVMPFFKVLSQFFQGPLTDAFNIYAANRMYWNIFHEAMPV